MTHTKKEEARRAIVLFGEVLAENAELRARVADLEELAANTQGLCEARPGYSAAGQYLCVFRAANPAPSAPTNFRGLVLGCIEAKFCKQIFV